MFTSILTHIFILNKIPQIEDHRINRIKRRLIGKLPKELKEQIRIERDWHSIERILEDMEREGIFERGVSRRRMWEEFMFRVDEHGN